MVRGKGPWTFHSTAHFLLKKGFLYGIQIVIIFAKGGRHQTEFSREEKTHSLSHGGMGQRLLGDSFSPQLPFVYLSEQEMAKPSGIWATSSLNFTVWGHAYRHRLRHVPLRLIHTPLLLWHRWTKDRSAKHCGIGWFNFNVIINISNCLYVVIYPVGTVLYITIHH